MGNPAPKGLIVDASKIRPEHYRAAGLECVDVERALVSPEVFAAHCRLTALEYVWRAGRKGELVDDLRKAATWLGWAVEALQERPNGPDLAVESAIPRPE